MNTLRKQYQEILEAVHIGEDFATNSIVGMSVDQAIEALIAATLEALPKEKQKSPNAIEFTFGNKKPEYIEAHSDKDIAYNQALSDIKALLGGK